MRNVLGGVLIHDSIASKSPKSVTHGQCNARLTVAFPTMGHHHRARLVPNYTVQ